MPDTQEKSGVGVQEVVIEGERYRLKFKGKPLSEAELTAEFGVKPSSVKVVTPSVPSKARPAVSPAAALRKARAATPKDNRFTLAANGGNAGTLTPTLATAPGALPNVADLSGGIVLPPVAPYSTVKEEKPAAAPVKKRRTFKQVVKEAVALLPAVLRGTAAVNSVGMSGGSVKAVTGGKVASAAAAVAANAPRNFAQGATVGGLKRSAVKPGKSGTMANLLDGAGEVLDVSDGNLAANVKRGIKAAINDTGAREVGAVVPELAPDTVAGQVYNTLTAIGSDPLNFVGVGAVKNGPRVAALLKAARQAGKGKAAAAVIEEAAPVVVVPPGPPSRVVPLSERLRIAGEKAAAGKGAYPPGVSGVEADLAARAKGQPIIKPAAVVVSAPPVPSASMTPAQALASARKAARAASPLGSLARRVGAGALDVLSLPKSLMASGDVSFALRQNAMLGASRPKQAAEAFGEGVKALVSQKSADAAAAKLKASGSMDEFKRFGGFIADSADGQSEEFFKSRLAEKIPGVGKVVKASDRSYSTGVNVLRASVWDTTTQAWRRAGITPEANPEEYRSLATYINSASGRGSLPQAIEKLEPALNAVFFAPRLTKSRFDLLNPVYYAKLEPAARKVALRDMAALAGSQAALLGLAKTAGFDIDVNPVSTNFGKVKVGEKTWVDFTAGLAPILKLVAQEVAGEKVTGSGKRKALDGKGKVPETTRQAVGETRASVALKFAEGRLAPVPSYFVDWWRGSDFTGKPFDAKQGAIDRALPFLYSDFRDALREENLLTASGAAGASGIGGSITTYSSEKPDKDAPKVVPGSEKVKASIQHLLKAVKGKGATVETVPEYDDANS